MSEYVFIVGSAIIMVIMAHLHYLFRERNQFTDARYKFTDVLNSCCCRTSMLILGIKQLNRLINSLICSKKTTWK